MNQDVDGPYDGCSLSGNAVDGVFVADVGGDAISLTSTAKDFVHCSAQFGCASCDKNNACSFSSKSYGERTSQPAAATRDQNRGLIHVHRFGPPMPETIRPLCHLFIRIANTLANRYCVGMASTAFNLATNIRQLREARGMTQEQMSRVS